MEYTCNVAPSRVLVPPRLPDVLDMDMNKDSYELWLAAQEALLSMRSPLSAGNSIQTMEHRLVRLTEKIISYDDDNEDNEMFVTKLPLVYYHATRVLLCLLAPLAPSFAEECWVLLHYGASSDSRLIQSDNDQRAQSGRSQRRLVRRSA